MCFVKYDLCKILVLVPFCRIYICAILYKVQIGGEKKERRGEEEEINHVVVVVVVVVGLMQEKIFLKHQQQISSNSTKSNLHEKSRS